MRTEKQKMLAGEMYDASDATLTRERERARDLCAQINALNPERDTDAIADLARLLMGRVGSVILTPPFYCDYGGNIELGNTVYFNFNCIILDVAPVTIADNVMFGPGVQLLTATHPMEASARNSGLELGAPITIGRDVWIGGGAIVCPGVSIGSGSVIGAGSVVTRDVPPAVFAAGNPCRVIKSID